MKKNEEENITLSEIVDNETDKKILEPVIKPVKKSSKYILGKALADHTFVRKEADYESEIVYFLKKDKVVTINPDFESEEFYKVTADSAVGYVPKDEIALI